MMKSQTSFAINHISVDCVVFGYDGNQLNLLLVERTGEIEGEQFTDLKLPGGLIYTDENLDAAAKRIIFSLTGMKKMELKQFKAYGSSNRMANPRDIQWLQQSTDTKIERVVTIAYVAIVKLSRTHGKPNKANKAKWVPIKDVPNLPFDHKQIMSEALEFIQELVLSNPIEQFALLPRKFTALQLRTLYNVFTNKYWDERNFHKKLSQMEYVMKLDEKEQGVAHRAARFYRFDKIAYNRTR